MSTPETAPPVRFDPHVLAYALAAAAGQIAACRYEGETSDDLGAATYLASAAQVQLSEAATALDLLLDVLRDDLRIVPQQPTTAGA